MQVLLEALLVYYLTESSQKSNRMVLVLSSLSMRRLKNRDIMNLNSHGYSVVERKHKPASKVNPWVYSDVVILKQAAFSI